MEKLRVSRVIIVEGKYDKIKLSSLVDGMIVPIHGFGIYKDKGKAALLRAAAKKQGAVILTDSDRAGFQLRGYLRSLLRDADVVHVYIPALSGKERRKTAPGAEGLLGVEGMDVSLLRELFLRSGALTPPSGSQENKRPVTRMDFYEDGLLGGPEASALRGALLQRLSLPGRMSGKALLEAVNALLSYDAYRALMEEIKADGPPFSRPSETEQGT